MSHRTYTRLTLTVFPVLLAGFALLYLSDRDAYLRLLDEDGVVEWTTVGLLTLAAGLAFLRARTARKGAHDVWRFYAALGCLCTLAVLEELSWGQRLLGVDSPTFFLRHSDQQEINLHNVFQQWSGVTTKWVAALALSAYGVVLPVLRNAPTIRVWTTRWHVVVPPGVLVPGFLAGALLMLDLPTYEEEEIAELFFALCFVLLLLQPGRPWPGHA